MVSLSPHRNNARLDPNALNWKSWEKVFQSIANPFCSSVSTIMKASTSGRSVYARSAMKKNTEKLILFCDWIGFFLYLCEWFVSLLRGAPHCVQRIFQVIKYLKIIAWTSEKRTNLHFFPRRCFMNKYVARIISANAIFIQVEIQSEQQTQEPYGFFMMKPK